MFKNSPEILKYPNFESNTGAVAACADTDTPKALLIFGGIFENLFKKFLESNIIPPTAHTESCNPAENKFNGDIIRITDTATASALSPSYLAFKSFATVLTVHIIRARRAEEVNPHTPA